jgi:hypothetical protein
MEVAYAFYKTIDILYLQKESNIDKTRLLGPLVVHVILAH